MKQLVQDIRTGDAIVLDVPAPRAQPGHVLIRVARSVVSPGTERSVVAFGGKSLAAKAWARPDLVSQVWTKVQRDGLLPTLDAVRQQIHEPMALGYSVAGVVLEPGAGVDGFAPGERVAAAGGGHAVHAEIVSVPVNLVVKVPAHVEFDAAAFTTLGAIALQGLRLAEVVVGESVAVIGLGILGQLLVQELRAAGCRVFAMDLAADRADLARTSGAECCATGADEFAARCAARTSGRGADAVLITADTLSSDPVVLAGEVARDRGRVVVVGAVGLEIPRKVYYEKELTFRISRSYGPGRYDPRYEEEGIDYPIGYVRWTENRNMQAFVAMLAEGRVSLAHLVTHRIPIDQGARAYGLLTAKSGERSLGVILSYPDGPPAAPPERRIEVQPARGGSAAAIGLIGAGKFAKATLLPAIKKAGPVRLVGVVSASGTSARHAADRFGFEYCATDWRALVADASVNTVVITTRHNLHAEQTRAALDAGKHVFVEKPLCLDEGELDAIADAYDRAQASGRAPLLMVGFNRRFAPLAVELRQAMSSVAEPLVIHYRVNAGRIPLVHWTQIADQGGGRLIGEMVHFIDWAIWLAGSVPVSVHASATPNQGIYNDDNLAVTLRFANGSVAQAPVPGQRRSRTRKGTHRGARRRPQCRAGGFPHVGDRGRAARQTAAQLAAPGQGTRGRMAGLRPCRPLRGAVADSVCRHCRHDEDDLRHAPQPRRRAQPAGGGDRGGTVHVLHVVGARPNFMKVAPVLRALHHRGVRQALVHTGQHYDDRMSAIFFDQLGLPQPDVDLGVGSDTHAAQTAEIMRRFEPVVLERRPDWVFVYGDVNSTMAAALVSVKLLVPVAHVEAGLRSGDRTMPEEINRLVTDHVADLLFTPSSDGDANLRREGIDGAKIKRVGNVMIDSLVRLLPLALGRWPALQRELRLDRYALVTLHRPSNVDDANHLAGLMAALTCLAREVPVVFPVHPRTRARLMATDPALLRARGIVFLEPLGYLDFLALQRHACVVITDSGGIQEETTYLGIPCLTLRPNTERPITVTCGTNRVLGEEPALIVPAVREATGHGTHQGTPPPLWDGHASDRIADIVIGL